MKIITLSLVGYNHPSQANWNYRIWKLDLIDSEQRYCLSHTLRETFGGNYRLTAKVREELGLEIIETEGVHTATGHQKITGVRSLLDIESAKVVEIIREFVGK